MATDAAIKKTISSMPLLKEQHRPLDAHWPMLQTILWLVVIGVALLFMPFSWLVTTLYDGLQLHLWWPVLILLLAFLFQKASDAGYQSSGLPQFLPGWALGLTILFLCTAILLMNATAADWSVGWLLILFTGLVLAIYRILPGLIGYSELWRLWVNSAVIETVGDQLLEQQFVEDLQSDRLHNEWGSLHKLTTLRGFYKATIIEVTLALLNGSTSTDSLIKCLFVGENLRQYLSLRWHEELLPPQRKQHEEEDLVRQLLTISLIAGYRQPSQQNYQDKLTTNPLLAVIATNSELASSNYTATALQQWLNSFQARQDSFGKLLNLIFTLGNRPEEFRSLTEIRECITQVYTLFSELPSAESADRQHNEQVELGQREICLATWLALAHRALPAQICFDVWLDLSKQNTTDPLLIAVNINDPEPVVIEAALFLANFYDRWSNQTPVFWNSGLQARAAYVRLQIDQIRQQITTQSSPLG